jgi:hypothetical protein
MPRPVRKHLKNLANRLREVAEAVGTQAEAARLAGVSLTQMQNYLAARSEPRTETLARLAVSSGFSLEWLISGSGPKRSSEASDGGTTVGDLFLAIAGSPTASKAHPGGTKELGAAAEFLRFVRAGATVLAGSPADEPLAIDDAELAVRLTQIAALFPRLARSVDGTGVFREESARSQFLGATLKLLTALARRLANSEAWSRALELVLSESSAAIANVADLAEGRPPSEEWLPVNGLVSPLDLEIWLLVRATVFQHLSRIDQHNPKAVTKRGRRKPT